MALTAGGTPNTGNAAGQQRDTSREGVRQEESGRIADRAREATSRVAGRADEAIAQVAERMTTIASNLREKAPKQGRVGNAVEAVASSLETSGQYLSQKDASAIAQDVTSMVRRYPMQSLWAGLGLGFIVGALTSRRRY